MTEHELPPDGFEAPWMIIARAGGPHGGSEHAEAKLTQIPGEPDEAALERARVAIAQTYRDVFGEDPARVGVGALPWYAKADAPEDDET